MRTPRDAAWTFSAKDSALVYMSKMYFDTTAASASRNEGATTRFSNASTSPESGHGIYGNKTLETGYKSQGSYLVDFRQFATAWNQRPHTSSYAWDTNDKGNSYAYGRQLSSKTYNTAARVTLTQELPSDYFDAYYLKVSPKVMPYVHDIEVVYSDGTSWKADASLWGDAGNAVERDEEGDAYYRLNLLKTAADPRAGACAFEPDVSDDRSAYYRDAFDAYTEDDFESGKYKTPVAKTIRYTVDINRSQYADDDRSLAAGVDFGTFYPGTVADVEQAAFEATGRFYKDDARSSSAANQAVSARIEIGGERGEGRHVRSAVERVSPSTSGYCAWSYLDYQYTSSNRPTYRTSGVVGHSSSSSQVDVIFDGNFVVKGTEGALMHGTYGDDHATFADDYYFDVAFARTHIPILYTRYSRPSDYSYSYIDSRPPDDWAGKVSFADKVVLSEDLPVCRPHADYGYYGFLATGMRMFAGDAGLQDNLDSVVFKTAVVDEAGTRLSTREVRVGKDDLAQYVDEAGDIFVSFVVPGEKGAPELEGKNAYELVLQENEFVTDYDVVLTRYQGDGDYAAETGAFSSYAGQRSGAMSQVDMRVFGRPYIYKGQTSSAQSDATNTVKASGYRSWTSAPHVAASFDDAPDYKNKYYSSDGAYYLGYLLPYSAGYKVTGTDADTSTESEFDYRDDNNTPTVVDYEVYFWNKRDENAGDRRSSRISKVSLRTQDTADYFRMQHIYLPKEFVEIAGNDAFGGWFKASGITLEMNGKKKTYTLQDLADEGVLSAAGDEYAVDVEAILRADIAGLTSEGLVGSYRMSEKTDTLGSVPASEDTLYAKASVKSAEIAFEAAAPSFDDADSVLSGGAYLSSDGLEGSAFRYDGVYVDRSWEDLKASAGATDGWNHTSTPTFGKMARTKSQSTTQTLSVASIESTDPNHDVFRPDSGTTSSHGVVMKNLRSGMDVTMARGKGVVLDGTPQVVFAYDLNNADATASYDPATGSGAIGDASSFAPEAGVGTDIANGALFAGDYVDYTVDLAAVAGYQGKQLALQQTDLRFEAPEAQRVVGWEIVDNTTGIPDESITAHLVEQGDANGDGVQRSRIACLPNTNYTRIDEAGSASETGDESYDYNRNLTISVGSFDADDPAQGASPTAGL